jgi:hypothetical protein
MFLRRGEEGVFFSSEEKPVGSLVDVYTALVFTDNSSVSWCGFSLFFLNLLGGSRRPIEDGNRAMLGKGRAFIRR